MMHWALLTFALSIAVIGTTGEQIKNRLHLAQKDARIFVRGHYLFGEANSFPRGKKRKTVRGQISEHI